ncbi:Sbal_3080 family lipoprotein [Shewanella frigidimarina]|uniref:Sbal_3080 family lipoprotein n=1 Tax=Shewanella frigidimarina TaxID=56812 RepID=UPI003FA155E3
MRMIILGLVLIAVTGCSSNGLTTLKQIDSNFEKEIVMTNDPEQTAQVRSIVTNWMVNNGYNVSKETASPNAELDDDQVMFEFNANWWWDMATYMRFVNLDVTDNKGNKVAELDFDSVRYGGFDKFGNAEERLNLIMEVFFQKISVQDAERQLENGKDKSLKSAPTCAYDC